MCEQRAAELIEGPQAFIKFFPHLARGMLAPAEPGLPGGSLTKGSPYDQQKEGVHGGTRGSPVRRRV